MAELQSFRHNQPLIELELNDVTFTGKTLGTGSFGSVHEVIYNHTKCAAKQLHEILLEDENEGVRNVVEKFQTECQLMARLRHPNITQFLGLFFMEDKQMPLLVVEKMETNLDNVLEFMPDLSLGVKICILEDVCNGLVYLHGQQPPVIHRDLSARNVLLTKALKAKITDMGNSRILDLIPGRQLTNQPGTLLYMPPEALDQTPQYGTPLDVFSFGHLTLYTLTQVFPRNLKSNTYSDPDNPTRIIARTELERREEYLGNLDDRIGHFYPALPQLVRNCLHNNPDERPNSKELLDSVREIREEEESRGEIVMHLDVHKLKMAKDKKITERRLLEEQERCQAAERQAQELERTVNELERQLQSKDERCRQMERRNDEMEEMIEEMNDTNTYLEERGQSAERRASELERELQEISERCLYMERRNNALQSHVEEAEETNSLLQVRCITAEARIRDLEVLSADMEGKRKSIIFNMQWRESPNYARSPSPRKYAERQLLIVQDKIYIMSTIIEQLAIIAELTYSTEITVLDTISSTSKWHYLPPLPQLQGCALVSLRNNLKLVGGHYRQEGLYPTRNKGHSMIPHHQTTWDCTTTDVQDWQRDIETQIPGDGITNCIATIYQHWLIIVGRSMENYDSVLLKLMDYNTDQWYIQSISFLELQGNFRSCLVRDRWYILSGSRHSYDFIHGISLPDLIQHITTTSTDTSSLWKIHRLPHQQSTPLCIQDMLFLVGGAIPTAKDKYVSMSTVLRYKSETDEWIIAGYLPFPIRNCNCAMTSDGQIFIIGGHTNEDFVFQNRNGEIILNI